MTAKPDRVLMYVPHSQVAAYEALGWRRLPGLEGTHHGHHATFMEWPDPCQPPKRPSSSSDSLSPDDPNSS